MDAVRKDAAEDTPRYTEYATILRRDVAKEARVARFSVVGEHGHADAALMGDR